MRRNYMSPEFITNLVEGTLSEKDRKNYFSSVLLNIKDTINIDNEDIVWYQKDNNEQLEKFIEVSNTSYISSMSDNKKDNSNLIKIDSKNNVNTIWQLNIQSKKILSNYLFAILKKERTFEKIKNKMTIYNDINSHIEEYIKENLINKYKYKNIEFFLQYESIEKNNNKLYENIWNDNLSNEFKFYDYRITPKNNNQIELSFLQNEPNKYIFNYYYNIEFEKI